MPSHGATRVFISHSCKDRLIAAPGAAEEATLERLIFARDLRDALRDALEEVLGEGSVWFDRSRLEPGDEWEQEIVEQLHTCDAAIVLLTQEALASPWVRREATTLADRRSRWRDLLLLPVFCAGTTAATVAVDDDWTAIGVTRWQGVEVLHGAVTGQAGRDDHDHVVREIVRLVTTHVHQGRGDPGFDQWVEETSAPLRAIGRETPSRLSRAAGALGLKAGPWDDRTVTNLARTLLQVEPSRASPVGVTEYPMVAAVEHLVGEVGTTLVGAPERTLCGRLKLAAISAAASVSCASAVAEHPDRPLLIELRESERTELAELVIGRACYPSAIFHRLTAVAGEESSALDESQLLALETWAKRTAALSTKKRYVAVPTSILADQDLEGEVHQMTSKIPAGVCTIVVVERGIPLPPSGDDIGVVRWSAADEDAAANVVSGLVSLVDLGA